MARYKVEYEIEGELRTTKDDKWKYIVGVGYDQWIPADATVIEIKPAFKPGYYRRREYGIGVVVWRTVVPPCPVEGEDWRDYYVRVEPEED